VKAVVVRGFAPFDQIEIGDLPDPKPRPGEVVIDVKAAEVNYPDLLVISGKYQILPPLPFAPGKAAAGVISAVGKGVEDFSVGDRVVAEVEYGAYAEKLLAPVSGVFELPAEIDFATGAALCLTYQTAYFALVDRARLAPDETVLVLGASGGVGNASIQLAKALGARTVIAGMRGLINAKLARQAGADAVIDLTGDDLRDRLRDMVRAATSGHGADIVIDPVGGEANAAALRAMAWRGRMVIVGFASGDIPAIKSNYLLVKNIEVSGLQWSDYRDRTPAHVACVQDEIFELHLAGEIDPHISRKFALKDFKQALALLNDGKAQGKVVLELA
jgi:NADPH:quinone reductase